MKRKKTYRLLIGFLGILFLLSITYSAGFAEIPKTINYQGYLTNTDGTPVDGQRDITFRIYNSETAAIWSETQTVTINSGIYSVVLGSVDPAVNPENPMDLPFDMQYWLGVQVVGETDEMDPRQPLTSVPYALNAGSVNGFDSTSFISSSGGTVSGALTIDGEVTITGGTPAAGKVLQSDAAGLASWEALSIDDLSDGRNEGSTTLSSLFLGSNAGILDNGNHANTAVGASALGKNISGGSNTAVGNNALANNTGSGNSAHGWLALRKNTSGGGNSAFGNKALESNTNGSFNTAIGGLADSQNNAGSYNTIIGYQAGWGTSGHSKSGNVFLGYKAGYNETGSNKLYIENSNSSPPLIGGDFLLDEIYLNGDVEISGKEIIGTPTLLSIGSTRLRVVGDSNDFTAGRFEANYSGSSTGSHTYGIIALNEGTVGSRHYGIYGSASRAPENIGVYGDAHASGADINYGLYGSANSAPTSYGVYGSSTSGPNHYAGYFSGKTHVTQDLSVAGEIQTSRIAYSPTRTHTYTVPASAFQFDQVTTSAYFINEKEISYSGNDSRKILAPVYLPDNAKLTTMTARYKDLQSQAGWDLIIELHKTTPTNPPGSSVIASLDTSGSIGYTSKTYTFSNETYDSLNAYTLKVYPQNNWLTDFTLVMVQITYEISEAE